MSQKKESKAIIRTLIDILAIGSEIFDIINHRKKQNYFKKN